MSGTSYVYSVSSGRTIIGASVVEVVVVVVVVVGGLVVGGSVVVGGLVSGGRVVGGKVAGTGLLALLSKASKSQSPPARIGYGLKPLSSAM